MSQDFYSVLGVAEDASQAEIKSAYRALARKYHPDRNPGNKEAESIFKDAAEAYRVLGDNDLRSQYDAHRTNGGRPGISNAETASDVLDDIFGGGAGGSGGRHASARGSSSRSRPGTRDRTPAPPPPRAPRGADRGDDIRYTLEIELEDAAQGAEHEIRVSSPGRCAACRGTGAEPGSAPVLCQACGGSGSVRLDQGFFSSLERCEECGGAGRLIARDCQACDGSGVSEAERPIRVQVPAGVDTGTRLKVAGEGMPGSPPGDLFVVIQIREHPLFQREGSDVITEVPVGFARASLGGEVEIPTLEGRMVMRVPAGSQSGRVFRLKGRGLPSLDNGARGDQRVRLVVEVPTELTDEQRQLLERFEALEGRKRAGSRQSEYRRLLDRYFG